MFISVEIEQNLQTNALIGTLFEQLPKAQIRSKFREKKIAHQIANNKMIVLSTENVQKSHMGPKLWGFINKLLDAQMLAQC